MDVVVSGDVGTSVTVPAGGTATLHITDTYTHATGSLVVNKLIAGPAAGYQGQVTISVSCGGTALADFVVPAGQTQPISKTYDDIAAGSTCTVDETVNGATSTVSVTTVGGHQSVTDRRRPGSHGRYHQHLRLRARVPDRPEGRGGPGRRPARDDHDHNDVRFEWHVYHAFPDPCRGGRKTRRHLLSNL